jgi:hypothetical protein
MLAYPYTYPLCHLLSTTLGHEIAALLCGMWSMISGSDVMVDNYCTHGSISQDTIIQPLVRFRTIVKINHIPALSVALATFATVGAAPINASKSLAGWRR